MTALFAQLAQEVTNYDGDFLLDVYLQGECHGDNKPYYLMQYCVACLFTGITIQRELIERAQAQSRPVTISDDYSGTGCRLIAFARDIRSWGFDPSQVVLAQLTDPDSLCMQMTFLQMSINHIPAVVIHGNSLQLQEFERAITTADAKMFGLRIWPMGYTPTEEEAPSNVLPVELFPKRAADQRLSVNCNEKSE